MLFHSLHDRLLQLPDATRVFPAHGAGSSCGKNLSDATESTIGEQRRTNAAVALESERAFVAAVTQGQPVAPAYFPYDAHLNREQRDLLDDQRRAGLALAGRRARPDGRRCCRARHA